MSNTADTAKQTVKINTNPFTRCFSGLDLLFKHNQTWAIIILFVTAIYGMGQFLTGFIPPAGESSGETMSTSSSDPVNVALILAVILPLVLFVLIGITIVSTYVNGIINYIAWKTSRLETATFSEAFKVVTKRFWTILALQIIVFFKVFGGFLLLIVPGIRAALRYQMVLFPVFDEGLNSKNAIKRIKGLSRNHLMEIFGIMTVSSIIPFIGLLVQMGGEAVMYPQLKELQVSGGPNPKVHWLNYLGLILLGTFLLLLAVIVTLILILTKN